MGQGASQGIRGDQGPLGPKGDQGNKGDKGDKGDKGVDSTVPGPIGEVSLKQLKDTSMWCADGTVCKLPPGKTYSDVVIDYNSLGFAYTKIGSNTILFQNSEVRENVDGGPNTATLRNDNGELRLQSKTGKVTINNRDVLAELDTLNKYFNHDKKILRINELRLNEMNDAYGFTDTTHNASFYNKMGKLIKINHITNADYNDSLQTVLTDGEPIYSSEIQLFDKTLNKYQGRLISDNGDVRWTAGKDNVLNGNPNPNSGWGFTLN